MAHSLLVSSRLCNILLLISLFLLFGKPANSQRLNCSITQDEYITNGPFHQNLKFVLRNLTVVANTTNSGFYNFTFGFEEDAVFGLYLCRGDLTPDRCSFCITRAGEDINEECPNKKEAIVWHDECILRYANRNIFSKEEEEPSAYSLVYFSPAPNPNRPPPPPPPARPFNVSNVLFELTNETAFGDHSLKSAPPFFTTREDNVTGGSFDQVLYSLAQCTPDISPFLCYKCLQRAINRVSCCISTAPTEVYLPSCLLQYSSREKFFESSNDNNLSSPPLLNSHRPPSGLPPESDIEDPENQRRWSYIAIVTAVPAAVLALLLLFGICYVRRRSNVKQSNCEIMTEESLQYDIGTIKTATANFSASNKLGQGAFGSVYKGTLENGQEIAVKRLPSNSRQGIQDFKTEALVIARLQHRNLVRLLGFCVTEEEKFFIYEFLPNSSLDRFLFDAEKRKSLLWETRYKIIQGVAKGLLYLHEHSQYSIVHQDLKPSNILLDKDMTPKISDFGMQKLIGEYQGQGTQNTIVGTRGYMAPEYIISGELSVKSNVYSFGVIVLEIMSGQILTNSYIHTPQEGAQEAQLQRARRLWNAKEPLAFLDQTMAGKFSAVEVTRCIHIGLLCVQEDVEKRPSIASIVSLLNSHSSNLPELAPGEGLYATDSSGSSLRGQQSTYTYSGMQDITELSAR